MRRLWLAAIFFTLAAPGFIAGEEKIPILPVSEIKPGMKGIAYTVFEGTEPETVPVEVVGVLKNAWGPRQDIILVHVGGRAAKTGVAAGMSGSPVYIDGKWVGAISLRFGLFPHEPLAGVTPAESMIAIQESDATPPAMASLPAPTCCRPAAADPGPAASRLPGSVSGAGAGPRPDSGQSDRRTGLRRSAMVRL